MEITRTAKPSKRMADLNVWYCEGCGVVHMSVNETVVNFTRQEFNKFAEDVTDINYSGWTHGKNGVIDLDTIASRYPEQ